MQLFRVSKSTVKPKRFKKYLIEGTSNGRYVFHVVYSGYSITVQRAEVQVFM